MTLQYNQDDINLRDAIPVSLTTIGDIPATFLLGEISDGGTLNATMFGGGSAPSAPSAFNWVNLTPANGVFTRQGGTGQITPGGPLLLSIIGVPIVVSYTFADNPLVTQCFITVAPPILFAETMNHRMQISRIRS
jgi:hypothetical protein